jgi:hypothetical protein
MPRYMNHKKRAISALKQAIDLVEKKFPPTDGSVDVDYYGHPDNDELFQPPAGSIKTLTIRIEW